jgi:hypothetical protein
VFSVIASDGGMLPLTRVAAIRQFLEALKNDNGRAKNISEQWGKGVNI